MTDDVDWQPGIVFTHTLSLTLDDKAQEILQGIRDQLMAVGVPVLHQPAHITVVVVVVGVLCSASTAYTGLCRGLKYLLKVRYINPNYPNVA